MINMQYVSVVAKPTVDIGGRSPAAFTMTVNGGAPVQLPDGAFNRTVDLGLKDNAIVFAADLGEAKVSKTIHVYYYLELSVNADVQDGEGGVVTGTGHYEYGAVITLKALPLSGYRFSHWSDGCTDAVREVTVLDDISLTAVFEKDGPLSPFWNTHSAVMVAGLLVLLFLILFIIWYRDRDEGEQRNAGALGPFLGLQPIMSSPVQPAPILLLTLWMDALVQSI